MKNKNLVISLFLVLISMFGASFIQTSGYSVKVKDLRWETPSGHLMSALLYIPKSATKDNPVPGIVTSHGWYNTREMQDLNYVEYARRGFVVMSIDMYGHGNSDPVKPEEWKNRGTGLYDAVELMARLPYIDKSKIGITGHSNGARASNWSVLEDNKKPKNQQLISSVLLIANDAMYTNEPNEPLYWTQRKPSHQYTNNYGTRDVGIIAAQYDEFFFRSIKEDGSITPPREYISTEYAQSFLNFGEDPNMEGTLRVAGHFYNRVIDGKAAVRIIDTPEQIHPWNHFSSTVVKNSLSYFERTIGIPKPIPGSDQIWQYKVFFNFLGVIGFFMFVIGITKGFLNTDYFKELKTKQDVIISQAPVGTAKLWFWGGLLISTLISAVSYIGVYNWSLANRPSFLLQPAVFYIGVWSLVMGGATILILLISYKFTSNKRGLNLRENGVIMRPLLWWKTILLSISVTTASFMLVFIADYFFKTDFRIWVITIKAFTPDKLWLVILSLPFFLVFYVANSVATNCFNFVKIGGKEWINTAIMMLFNGLSAAVLISIQYLHFYITGDLYFDSVSPLVGIWLFPIIVIIPLAALITRIIYKETRNPYLGGMIYSLIVTILLVTNTLTQL